MEQEREARITALRHDIQRCVDGGAPANSGLRVGGAFDAKDKPARVFESHSPVPALRRRVVMQIDEPEAQFRWAYLLPEEEQQWDGKWAKSRDVSEVPDNACTQLIAALRQWGEGQSPADPF